MPCCALAVSAEAGVFAVFVHAMSDSAGQFNLSRGFVESPLRPLTLGMTLATVREILRVSDGG